MGKGWRGPREGVPPEKYQQQRLPAWGPQGPGRSQKLKLGAEQGPVTR